MRRFIGASVVHGESPIGDGMTLCGDTVEGDEKLGLEPLTESPDGEINCEGCLCWIRHCRIEDEREAARFAYEMAAQIAGRHEKQAKTEAERCVARSIEKEIRWAQGSKRPRRKKAT